MRALKPEELDIVAGGYDTSQSPPIYVTGTRLPTILPPTEGGSGGPSGGVGGGGSQLGSQGTELAKPTPCVHAVPTGVDLQTLNNEIKFLADELAHDAASTGNEWAGFVYRMPNGQLYETSPLTAGHPDDVNGIHVSLPYGAVIVGYVHTHPFDPGFDETELSPDDRSFINNLISSGHADPNMVAYINTPDDTGTATTYAYDANHRSQTSSGCSL